MINKIKEIIKKAGLDVFKIYNSDDYQIKKKDDNSPVTIADKISNEIILDWLKQFDYKILSDESDDDLERLNSDYVWIVDPLDWTKDFINKTWEFSLMIWLVKNNQPVLGFIYVPINDKLYFAEKWKWTFMTQKWETKQLFINKENKNILVSRSHLSQEEIKIIEKLNLTKISCWSAGVKCGLIAEWKAWNYLTLYNNFKEWDTCAWNIILTEAWWVVTDINWKTINYNKKQPSSNWFVATNWTNHKIILKQIKNND